MKVALKFGFLFLLLDFSLTYGQQPPAAASPSRSQPIEIRLTSPVSWKGNCLEISIKLVNHSKSPIFLDPTPFDGIRIYSSVTDTTNSLGQGAGQAWILVYGWSDVLYLGAKGLAPGTGRPNTYCIGDTFEVTERETEEFRQVRLQGRLRIVAGYEQKNPERKVTKRQQEKMTRTYLTKKNNSDSWTGGETMLEIPIPCPPGFGKADCISPPPIFQGEREVWGWRIEMEPPPVLEVEPPSLPAFPASPPPPPPRQ